MKVEENVKPLLEDDILGLLGEMPKVDAAIIYGILIIIVSLLGRLLEKRFTVAGKETQRILISEE